LMTGVGPPPWATSTFPTKRLMRREELTIRREMQVLKIHCDEIDGSWLNG